MDITKLLFVKHQTVTCFCPLFATTGDLEVAECDHGIRHEPNTCGGDVSESVDNKTLEEDMAPPLQKPQQAKKG